MSQIRKKAHVRDTHNEILGQPNWPSIAPGSLPLLKLLIELTEMGYSAAKKLMIYTIEATEGAAKGVVDGQRLASGWAKDTPVAPLLEEQQHITYEFISRSAELTRRLWLLQLEQSEEAVERVEEGLLPLARAQT